MTNEWTPGWMPQLFCMGLGALWIFGPRPNAAAAAAYISASFVIGVMRTLHKEKS